MFNDSSNEKTKEVIGLAIAVVLVLFSFAGAFWNFSAATDAKYVCLVCAVASAAFVFGLKNSLPAGSLAIAAAFFAAFPAGYSAVFLGGPGANGYIAAGMSAGIWMSATGLAACLALLAWIALDDISLISKGVIGLPLLYSGTGFVNSIAQGVSPEFMILGAGIFKKFPAIAQPSFVFYNLAVPAAMIGLLFKIASGYYRKSPAAVYNSFFALVCLATIAAGGYSLMNRFLVPNVTLLLFPRPVVSAYGKFTYVSPWEPGEKGPFEHEIEVYTKKYKTTGKSNIDIAAKVIPSIEVGDRNEIVFSFKGGVASSGVANIKSEDLEVIEDGVKQPHVLFASSSSESGNDLIICLDVSGSMSSNMEALKEAASFFVRGLPADFRVRLVSFSSDIKDLTNEFTAKKTPLLEKLSGLKVEGATVLFDAVCFCADIFAKDRITGGSLVVFTDGGDSGSKAKIGDVYEKLSSAGVKTYAIGLGPGVDSKKMKQIAKANNGQFFHAQTPDALKEAFNCVLECISCKYSIKYAKDVGPPPAVEILKPSPGVPASGPGGTVDIEARVAGKIKQVDFYFDNKPLKKFTEKREGVYKASKAGAETLKNGNYAVAVVATDIYGRREEASLEVGLKNSVTPFQILAPKEGEEAAGTLKTRVRAADQKFDYITFAVDGKDVKTFAASAGPEFDCEIPLSGFAQGAHILKVTVTAVNGQKSSNAVKFRSK